MPIDREINFKIKVFKIFLNYDRHQQKLSKNIKKA